MKQLLPSSKIGLNTFAVFFKKGIYDLVIFSSSCQDEYGIWPFLERNRIRAEAYVASSARNFWPCRHSSTEALQTPGNKLRLAKPAESLQGRPPVAKQSTSQSSRSASHTKMPTRHLCTSTPICHVY